jgi:hypothetical protein
MLSEEHFDLKKYYELLGLKLPTTPSEDSTQKIGSRSIFSFLSQEIGSAPPSRKRTRNKIKTPTSKAFPPITETKKPK